MEERVRAVRRTHSLRVWIASMSSPRLLVPLPRRIGSAYGFRRSWPAVPVISDRIVGHDLSGGSARGQGRLVTLGAKPQSEWPLCFQARRMGNSHYSAEAAGEHQGEPLANVS